MGNDLSMCTKFQLGKMNKFQICAVKHSSYS